MSPSSASRQRSRRRRRPRLVSREEATAAKLKSYTPRKAKAYCQEIAALDGKKNAASKRDRFDERFARSIKDGAAKRDHRTWFCSLISSLILSCCSAISSRIRTARTQRQKPSFSISRPRTGAAPLGLRSWHSSALPASCNFSPATEPRREAKPRNRSHNRRGSLRRHQRRWSRRSSQKARKARLRRSQVLSRSSQRRRMITPISMRFARGAWEKHSRRQGPHDFSLGGMESIATSAASIPAHRRHFASTCRLAASATIATAGVRFYLNIRLKPVQQAPAHGPLRLAVNNA